MADQDAKPQYLQLVTDASRTTKQVSKRETQLELFLDREPNVLGLFLLSPPRMRLFARAIDSVRPKYVFDLRVLPAFEGAGTSRRSLFRTMEAVGCTYVDAMGMMGGWERRDAFLHSGAFERCVRSTCGDALVGPMFFLFQSVQELAWSCSVLPQVLHPAPRSGWSVHVLGAGGSDPTHVSQHVSFQAVEAPFAADPVQPWSIGDVLYVVASPFESTGWLLDDRGRPIEPVNLRRGCSVRVVALQIGQWTDVEVLGGPHQGCNVRLASNAHVAHLVK